MYIIRYNTEDILKIYINYSYFLQKKIMYICRYHYYQNGYRQ